MRRADYAGRSGNWESYMEEFQKDGRLSARASMNVKECFEKAETEDIGRLSIAQDILWKTHIFRGGLLRPSVEWEVSPCRTCALIVIASRLRPTFGGCSGHGDGNWWCAACGG